MLSKRLLQKSIIRAPKIFGDSRHDQAVITDFFNFHFFRCTTASPPLKGETSFTSLPPDITSPVYSRNESRFYMFNFFSLS